jgi:hypothetical protein
MGRGHFPIDKAHPSERPQPEPEQDASDDPTWTMAAGIVEFLSVVVHENTDKLVAAHITAAMIQSGKYPRCVTPPAQGPDLGALYRYNLGAIRTAHEGLQGDADGQEQENQQENSQETDGKDDQEGDG